MDYHVGAGGWAYFQIPGMDNLSAYSRGFDYVEVNSTFYDYPEMAQVSSWRKRVPGDFRFNVRCHQDLTHIFKLEPVEESFLCLSKMIEICRTLGSEVLHLQTPPSFDFGNVKIDAIGDFLSSADLKGIRFAWEVRRPEGTPISPALVNLMKDQNIIQCTDLSREDPVYESDILYTRLFGKGAHNLYQFTDEELREIDEKVRDSGSKKAYVTFHGSKMYKDAARMKVYMETGEFPQVTKSIGLESLEEVLREDARFPATREELIAKQGWKVIGLDPGSNVHASEVLERLPEKKFFSAKDVIGNL